MNNFDKALKRLLVHEGGYVNIEADCDSCVTELPKNIPTVASVCASKEDCDDSSSQEKTSLNQE